MMATTWRTIVRWDFAGIVGGGSGRLKRARKPESPS